MALFAQLLSFFTTTILSKNIFFIILGIFGVGFIVAFHEFGHLIFCKIFNIKAPSFSIGMGPRLISKKFGTTEYSISAIPIGGYVEMAQSSDDALAPASDKTEHYFDTRPYWQKMLVMSGGIMFNMLFAYTIFTLLYFFGMPNTPIAYPENALTVVSSIVKDSPAEKANLQIGDTIIAINGVSVHGNVEELFAQVGSLANQTAHFTIERNKDRVEVDVTLIEKKIGDTSVGFLGVGFETTTLPGMPFFTALKRGVARTNLVIKATLQGFKAIFSKRNIDSFGGPIMIISQTIQHAERGIKIFLAFLALISINLAILNLIPLPILDGGQALFATIEALIRRPLNVRIREYLALATWAIFILLTLYISFKDIKVLRAVHTQEAKQESTLKS